VQIPPEEEAKARSAYAQAIDETAVADIRPERIKECIGRGGYATLQKVLTAMTPEEVIAQIRAASLRGRGGAGFPTGVKWEFCRRAEGDLTYIICNADEGDPGARLIRSRPHSVKPAGDSGDLEVRYLTESGEIQDEIFDAVVLSVSMVIPPDVVELAEKLEVPLSPNNFVEASCFEPTSTFREEIFSCGAFNGPKDIPQSVMEGSAAAATCPKQGIYVAGFTPGQLGAQVEAALGLI
jgi:hypothetical protein